MRNQLNKPHRTHNDSVVHVRTINKSFRDLFSLLPTAREGNVFRSVCKSFFSQGGGTSSRRSPSRGGLHLEEGSLQRGSLIPEGGLRPGGGAEGVGYSPALPSTDI